MNFNEHYQYILDIINDTHVLIGGCTGCGKSTFIKNILFSLYRMNPQNVKIVLIDNKGTTFKPFKNLPHTIRYCVSPESCARCLSQMVDLMLNRYETIKDNIFQENFNGSHIYIVIDELCDLLTNSNVKNSVLESLTRIAQLGRASNIHIIACTQSFTKDIVGRTKDNFTCICGLKTLNAVNSRSLIQQKGCESLEVGKVFVMQKGMIKKHKFEPIPTEQLKQLLDFWGVSYS